MNHAVRAVRASVAVLGFLMFGAGIAAAHPAQSEADRGAGATLRFAPTPLSSSFTDDVDHTALGSASGRDSVSETLRLDGPQLGAAGGRHSAPADVYCIGYRVVLPAGEIERRVPSSGTAAIPADAARASTSTGSAPSRLAAPAAPAAPAGADTKTSVISAGVAGLVLGGVIAFWQSRKHRRGSTLDETDYGADEDRAR